ncbi:hypothetical protein FHX49_001070 [Microbacterium endophyticum]|uniref:Cell wall protein n=1 Tax=Microbacterium endophyticum TaxID=1526412 RepID=A0A7W4YMH8_9MICO|nr:lamin tail domain-containing protein [Microbacterium endophyticum]MBB2975504.1 hypothetical protein [Microbacterium endophyticum]NIK35477.1 hypothetical protein [Microbacterium endophyticum]
MPRLFSGLAATVVCALGAAVVVAVPTAAIAADSGIRINEIESSGGTPGDWVELYNPTSAAIALDGYQLKDSDDAHVYTLPVGTTIEPGAYLVLNEVNGGVGDFDFGLGKADSARLFDASNNLVDGYEWSAHADVTWGINASGEWAQTLEATKGAANVFDAPTEPTEPSEPGEIVINEIDSQPADWVEFYNPSTEALDISGYEIRDNSDDHRWQFPAGSSIAAGEYLVVDEATMGLSGGVESRFSAAIGIGSADRIRLYDAELTMIDDSLPWSGHAAIDGDAAAATLARCPDGEGDFVLAYPTPGESNSCVLPDVVINEVESNGDATDWIEVINMGSTTVDLSGWSVMDSDPVKHSSETTPLPEGTTLAPGALFVFDQPTNFTFGLGNGDTATVRNARGATVDEYVYTAHANGVWARCADGTGDFIDVAVSTKGERNACGNPVRINEVESDGGDPGDWVELVNPTESSLDVSGLIVKDDDDTHSYVVPEGTVIAAGAYLVIEGDQLGFGLGKADSVRVFEGDALRDSTTWGPDHAATTWGRCPDASGSFAVTAESTKGAANICVGEIAVEDWPGSAEVTVVDETSMFLSDSSGLDTQVTDEGTFLWAVDNGTGTFWKLDVAADGTTTFADGWESGKRARFQKDAADASAAGPDTEGITVDGNGWVYVASERDNSAKGVNQNKVLKLDPNAAGPDVVATQEWDLTSLLPAVGANLGAEAVEWVSDADLSGLVDDNTGKAYDPASYSGHGDGLFFVALEDNGHVYAFALNADGSAQIVSEIDAGLPAAMSLDYDTALDVLWVVCDNGCDGTSAQVTFNGTANPTVAHFARAAGLPNDNNEGFATSPTALADGSGRPVWWFTDGVTTGAMHQGTLPGGTVAPTDPTDPTDPTNPTDPTVPVDPELPTTGPDVFTPLDGDALVEGNRGTVTAPASAQPGSAVTINVGVQHAGTGVKVWMYSTPQQIGAGTLDALGNITVTIPSDAPIGMHRLAVYSNDGELLGWTSINIVSGGKLAVTGADSAAIAGAGGIAALMMLIAGAALLVARRRARTE